MVVHELKLLREYFQLVNEGVKTFEIRKNDRNYQVKDFLKLKEFDGERYTGRELIREVTYMTSYEQKEDYVVLAITEVPRSFATFLSLTDKEQTVFKELITHIYLYGLSDRDTTNTFWDIIRALLENDDLSETDQQWYMKYWVEGKQK